MPKRIYHCYFDRKRNVRHFFLEIILRSRTSRILDRYEERGSIESKKNIGILVTLLSVVFLHNVYYKNKIQLYKVKTRPIQEHVSIFVFCSFQHLFLQRFPAISAQPFTVLLLKIRKNYKKDLNEIILIRFICYRCCLIYEKLPFQSRVLLFLYKFFYCDYTG